MRSANVVSIWETELQRGFRISRVRRGEGVNPKAQRPDERKRGEFSRASIHSFSIIAIYDDFSESIKFLTFQPVSLRIFFISSFETSK